MILLGIRPPQITGERKFCLFYPGDKFKDVYWDVFISMILILSLGVTPINIAFSEELELFPGFLIFVYSIDLFFVIDIFISFNTSFMDEKGKLIDDRCHVAKEYLTGWFFIDFISVLPFDLILEASTNGAHNIARIARVSKLYKLVKITRLIRFLKMLKKNNRINKKISTAAQYERLGMFILALLLLAHFIGCMWIFAGKAVEGSSWITEN